MIISHKYKCIFIKTKKTAGTSLEIAFSKFLGPDDIITPVSGIDEVNRQEKYGVGCQHFRKSFSEYCFKDFARLFAKGIRARKYWNHISAELVRQNFGEDLFDSYYKFTVERNPWDKVVSRFHWKKSKEIAAEHEKDKFKEYIRSGEAFHNGTGYEMYTINNVPAMDYFILYEDIETGLKKVSETLNLNENLYDVMKKIKAKGNNRPQKESYHSYYDDETQNIVATACAREIELFGYKF